MTSMPTRNPSVFGLYDVLSCEPEVLEVVEFYRKANENEAVALEFHASDFLRTFQHLKPQAVVVLVLLPSHFASDLESIAFSEPSVYNEYSPDLMGRDSYIGFKGFEFEVRLNLWLLRLFAAIDNEVGVFAFVAADKIAIRQLERSEELDAACQVACIASGPNYKPRRVWSEEEIAAAENTPETVSGNIMTIGEYVTFPAQDDCT